MGVSVGGDRTGKRGQPDRVGSLIRHPIAHRKPIAEACGAMIGGSISGGRFPRTKPNFSATICRSVWMLVPQSNSTHTTEKPTAVADRTRRTRAAPFIAVSMGNVTSVSTSVGAMPWASVRIVTVGAVKSGKTSTGIVVVTYSPTAIKASESSTTRTRLFSER